jgi:hypothetical protein
MATLKNLIITNALTAIHKIFLSWHSADIEWENADTQWQEASE